MADLRKDPVTGRWVIISTERQKRPTDFQIETVTTKGDELCPFCQGHEDQTPPEILSYRNGGGWDVRVVPNKFPALRVEGDLDREGEGLFDRMNGIGAHEVIIETPHHDQTLATMAEQAIEKVFWAWRERVLDLKRDIRLRHIVHFQESWRLRRRVARALALAAHRAADRAARAERRAVRREEAFSAARALRVLRHHPAGSERWDARDRRICRLRRDGALRAAISVRDVADAQAAPVAVRGHDAGGVREPRADVEGHSAADERDAAERRRTISSSTARRCRRSPARTISITGTSR